MFGLAGLRSTLSVKLPLWAVQHNLRGSDSLRPFRGLASHSCTSVSPEMTMSQRERRSILVRGDVSVIFVLGGPGAGKGTQCKMMAEKYDFVHLSLGDVLREEIGRPGSKYGPTIKQNMREGRVGPMEVTVELLGNAITDSKTQTNKTRFLIDGFPRKIDQALLFEELICSPQWIVVFECPDDILQQRLLNRAFLGRFDDNTITIKKRIDTFHNTTIAVLDHYLEEGKVRRVNAQDTREEVFIKFEKALGRMCSEYSHEGVTSGEPVVAADVPRELL